MSKKVQSISMMPVEIIHNKIYWIRGNKVMLDRDLAELYGVSTKQLKQQVRRNFKRFPDDFMFELTWEEAGFPRSHSVTLESGKNIKYLPYAFTEQGIAMLSSVLNSDRAVEVNIQIIRTFTKLREMMSSHKDFARKIEEMEKKYDHQFKIVFDAIKQILQVKEEENKNRGPIGFQPPKPASNNLKGKKR